MTTNNMMKMMCTALLAVASGGMADSIILDNQTTGHPSKMVIHWVASGEEARQANYAVRYDSRVDPQHTQPIQGVGPITLTVPEHAESFRILVWEEGDQDPLLTNWVDVIPDKTYVLQDEHLSPTVLMAGTGC